MSGFQNCQKTLINHFMNEKPLNLKAAINNLKLNETI